VAHVVGQDGDGGAGSQEYLRDKNINAKADRTKREAQISNASDADAADALAQAQKAAKNDEEREPLQVRSYTQKVRIKPWCDIM
jgi:hypothetical protein